MKKSLISLFVCFFLAFWFYIFAENYTLITLNWDTFELNIESWKVYISIPAKLQSTWERKQLIWTLTEVLPWNTDNSIIEKQEAPNNTLETWDNSEDKWNQTPEKTNTKTQAEEDFEKIEKWFRLHSEEWFKYPQIDISKYMISSRESVKYDGIELTAIFEDEKWKEVKIIEKVEDMLKKWTGFWERDMTSWHEEWADNSINNCWMFKITKNKNWIYLNFIDSIKHNQWNWTLSFENTCKFTDIIINDKTTSDGDWSSFNSYWSMSSKMKEALLYDSKQYRYDITYQNKSVVDVHIKNIDTEFINIGGKKLDNPTWLINLYGSDNDFKYEDVKNENLATKTNEIKISFDTYYKYEKYFDKKCAYIKAPKVDYDWITTLFLDWQSFDWNSNWDENFSKFEFSITNPGMYEICRKDGKRIEHVEIITKTELSEDDLESYIRKYYEYLFEIWGNSKNISAKYNNKEISFSSFIGIPHDKNLRVNIDTTEDYYLKIKVKSDDIVIWEQKTETFKDMWFTNIQVNGSSIISWYNKDVKKCTLWECYCEYFSTYNLSWKKWQTIEFYWSWNKMWFWVAKLIYLRWDYEILEIKWFVWIADDTKWNFMCKVAFNVPNDHEVNSNSVWSIYVNEVEDSDFKWKNEVSDINNRVKNIHDNINVWWYLILYPKVSNNWEPFYIGFLKEEIEKSSAYIKYPGGSFQKISWICDKNNFENIVKEYNWKEYCLKKINQMWKNDELGLKISYLRDDYCSDTFWVCDYWWGFSTLILSENAKISDKFVIEDTHLRRSWNWEWSDIYVKIWGAYAKNELHKKSSAINFRIRRYDEKNKKLIGL